MLPCKELQSDVSAYIKHLYLFIFALVLSGIVINFPDKAYLSILLIGIFICSFAFVKILAEYRMQQWHQATISTILQKGFGILDEGGYLGMDTSFYPVIEYSYQVNNHEYNSNVVCKDLKSIIYVSKDELCSKLEHEDFSTVYYNPLKPEEAVLVRALTRQRKRLVYRNLLIGLLIIFISLFFATDFIDIYTATKN